MAQGSPSEPEHQKLVLPADVPRFPPSPPQEEFEDWVRANKEEFNHIWNQPMEVPHKLSAIRLMMLLQQAPGLGAEQREASQAASVATVAYLDTVSPELRVHIIRVLSESIAGNAKGKVPGFEKHFHARCKGGAKCQSRDPL